jgi:ketosteroid isomerase-like protein
MDDIYKINLAKTEFREAYNTGNVDRLLTIFDSDGFTNMSVGEPSKYGQEAISVLREKVTVLFKQNSVKLTPIIIDIIILGDTAYDYGWHEFTLLPKDGGEPIRKRQRYLELWNRKPDGDWKISLHINNEDVREELGGTVSRWFLSEQQLGAALN